MIKFNNLTNRLLYIDYKNKLQYIIIQTESDYYHLVLADRDNGLNIRQNIKGGMTPTRLKFNNNSILSVQNYNNNDVICNLCYTNVGVIFEVYFVFELNKPIFNVDFKYFGSKLDLLRDQVINAYLYEKLLLVLIKREDLLYSDIVSYNKVIDADNHTDSSKEKAKCCYKILVVNLLITDLTCIERLYPEEKIWCNLSYSLLDSPVLSEFELPFDKIIKVSYSDALINFTKQLEKSWSEISTEFSTSNADTALLLKKYKDKIKLFSNKNNDSSKDRSNIRKSTDPDQKAILYILSEKALYSFNFKSYLLKRENTLNYFRVQLKLGDLLSYDIVRRLELFNLCTGEKLFESIDEIIKETERNDHVKSLVLKLLWSHEIKEKFNFYEIIEKYFSDSTLSNSEELQIWNILVDYQSTNMLNKFLINKENFLNLSFLHLIKLTRDYKKSQDMIEYLNANMIHKVNFFLRIYYIFLER